MYEPQHLQRWSYDGPTPFDSRSNYMGGDLREWFVVIGYNRDSSILEKINFQTVKEDLEKYERDITTRDGEEEVSVQVHRFNHWACGWYELLLVHESDEETLMHADEWAKALADYPVADEEKYSEAVYEEACSAWEHMSIDERVAVCQKYGATSVFAARRDDLSSIEFNGCEYPYDYIAGEV